MIREVLLLIFVIHLMYTTTTASVLTHTSTHPFLSLLIEMIIIGVSSFKLIIMGPVELLIFQAILLHVVIGRWFLKT